MRVLVLIRATVDTENDVLPSPELLKEMGDFNEALLDAGILLAGEGLHPSSRGKRVVFEGPERTVVDGPFGPLDSLIAGFWLWQVKDMEEAVEWVKRCPNPLPGRGEVEIRPIYENEDFGDAIPEEVVKQDMRLRERLAERK